jgi:hypothetical protein
MDELDQNLFKSDSCYVVVPLTGSRNGKAGEDFDGGKIKSKISSSKGKSTEVDIKFIITDTRMQVFLRKG